LDGGASALVVRAAEGAGLAEGEGCLMDTWSAWIISSSRSLEKHDLTPSSEADARTLIRRLTFDLTGLPPTPEEVRAFVNDTRTDAYARLVDDLMGRRAFGERMASVWLNLARYAEDQAHQVGRQLVVQLSERLALSRLGHRGIQCRPAVRCASSRNSSRWI
jgi:hypothetical protein